MNADTLIADSTYVDVPAMPWKPTRFPGVEAKTLMENPATGMSTVLMRWAPGARLPQHEHVAIEQTFVLEGSFADHMGVCRAGNYVWRRAVIRKTRCVPAQSKKVLGFRKTASSRQPSSVHASCRLPARRHTKLPAVQTPAWSANEPART